MTAARVYIHDRFSIGTVDRRLFGSFVEHMGRCVYGGIFEPGHPSAGEDGFRKDVLELVRELRPTLIRYPGGNFVSGYDWENGVGPIADRPVRLDLAWRSLESNRVGTNEFIDWCKLAAVEPMLAVNLGTRGVDAARCLVEYCNVPAGTHYADLRRAHGYEHPHNVRLWCLGNEMDGPWQIGHKEADEYSRLALEAGKAMRAVDPELEFIVCGSSSPEMPTFGTWEETVLERAWDVTDYLSVHRYYDPDDFPDVAAYLACSRDLDRTIEAVTATADAVAARRRSPRRIPISLDEWNVWHLRANRHVGPESPAFAPAIGEDDFTLADALVVGCMLISMLRHADRVRIGCVAQLVNILGQIRTLDDGPAWRQSIYFPFQDVARFAHGTSLQVAVDGPSYQAPGEGEVPSLEIAAVKDSNALALFAVNRGDAPIDVRGDLSGFGAFGRAQHSTLTGSDLEAANRSDRFDAVRPEDADEPKISGGILETRVEPFSWNCIRLELV